MANIGKPKRIIKTDPIRVPEKAPVERPAPLPDKEKEKVPA